MGIVEELAAYFKYEKESKRIAEEHEPKTLKLAKRTAAWFDRVFTRDPWRYNKIHD